MRFRNALDQTELKGNAEAEYKAARRFGVVRTGEQYLFFRSGLKTFAVPYERITRCFRRVMLVPLKLCCGKGEMAVEHLVIHTGDTELAQIQLPGTREAKLLMEELKKKIPGAEFTCPDKTA